MTWSIQQSSGWLQRCISTIKMPFDSMGCSLRDSPMVDACRKDSVDVREVVTTVSVLGMWVSWCRSRFPNAVEASSFARYTWPSVAARAFGCVDVLSWDRRYDSAMLTYTRRALHGVGPLPTGDKSRQITKTDVTMVSHERPSLFLKSTSCDSVRMQECKCVPCLYTRVHTCITLT